MSLFTRLSLQKLFIIRSLSPLLCPPIFWEKFKNSNKLAGTRRPRVLALKASQGGTPQPRHCDEAYELPRSRLGLGLQASRLPAAAKKQRRDEDPGPIA